MKNFPVDALEGHADLGYDSDLNQLHILIMEIRGLVMDQTRLAVQSFKPKDAKSAETVIDHEHELDRMEVDLDDRIVSLISCRGPIARNLRITKAFSKIITDLERAGDEAARIATQTIAATNHSRTSPSKELVRDITLMGKLALNSLEKAMKAFDLFNPKLAAELLQDDQEMNSEFKSSLRRLTTFVLEDARNVGHVVDITLTIKSLERVGDYAQNIAEYVIYLVNGIDVRQQQTSSDQS